MKHHVRHVHHVQICPGLCKAVGVRAQLAVLVLGGGGSVYLVCVPTPAPHIHSIPGEWKTPSGVAGLRPGLLIMLCWGVMWCMKSGVPLGLL